MIYTETDCVSELPMFRGDLATKVTYRVARSDDDPDNSVRVKVRANPQNCVRVGVGCVEAVNFFRGQSYRGDGAYK